MSKPYYTRKIADDVVLTEEIWFREGEMGHKAMFKKVEWLNECVGASEHCISYFCSSDFKKRKHEYYITIQESGV